MKHTPGPWRLIVGEYGCKRIGPSRPGHQRGIREVCATVGLFDEDQDSANARLIAAAPELLEALEGLLDCEAFSACTECEHRAERAIARARGE